jgi:hypothetical protein
MSRKLALGEGTIETMKAYVFVNEFPAVGTLTHLSASVIPSLELSRLFGLKFSIQPGGQ